MSPLSRQMLSVAEEYLRELNADARLEVFGQELNPESYAICVADLMMKTYRKLLPALLLGPLCVATARSGQGYGRSLVAQGLARAKAGGVRLVLLVGDSGYYARFGFAHVPPGQISMPGPVDLKRLLAAELRPGVLADYRGMMTAAA